MAQVLWSAAGLGVVWIVTLFVGLPVRSFLDLRRQVVAARLRALNTPVNLRPRMGVPIDAAIQKDIDRLEDAKDELRKVAVGMEAFGQAEPVSKLLRWFGHDAQKISNAAAAYANSLDGPIGRRAEYDQTLRRALKIS